jgi:hypothetical protein
MTEQEIQKQIEQILRLDRESITPNVSGMDAYGSRFENQRDYYQGLSKEEKRSFESAVITISQMHDVENANLGLYICTELADLFPENWRDRVIDLVQSLIDQDLPIAYHNSISFAVIRLIREFHVKRLVPFVQNYLQDLKVAFKAGSIQRTEFYSLYDELNMILISVSPNDFWSEFTRFNEDKSLIGSVGNELYELSYFWASMGVRLYGMDWLRKLAIECNKISDYTTKRTAYQAIYEHAQYLAIDSIDEREIAEFLDWLQETYGYHVNRGRQML